MHLLLMINRSIFIALSRYSFSTFEALLHIPIYTNALSVLEITLFSRLPSPISKAWLKAPNASSFFPNAKLVCPACVAT